MRFGVIEFLFFPLSVIVPALILYFVVKLAVKNAIRELTEENIL